MDKYAILKEIGSGSFGKVYVVELKGLGMQYVAKQIDLKRLNKRQKALAEKEIHVLSKLKHGNIVGYKEAYSDEKHLHIVMELCELGDLHGLIMETRASNGAFSEVQVMDYFVQICLALEYIHRLRILHRDVKTKNIFLTKRNIVKLGDFGVAKILEDSFELARTCIGSPFYISPEICENQPYDKKSDIWALGCVLYELATLRYAFTAKNMKTLLMKISAGDCNSLPANISVKIRYLIGRILQPHPKDRPSCTQILSMPFVEEYKAKITCKSKTVVNIGRSKSGDDLRTKEGCALRFKTTRSMLPISKSSFNLNSGTNITDPGTKYKTSNACKQKAKQVVSKFNFRKSDKREFTIWNNEVDLSREDGTSNLDRPKIKKLPKADSLYYTMIEDDNNGLAKGPTTIIKNIFVEAKEQESICKTSSKRFDSTVIEKPCGDETNTQPEEINEVPAEIPSRKQWQISTANKNELITFLNDVELIGADSDIAEDTVILGKHPSGRNLKSISVDDMLSLGTTNLIHAELLQPEVLERTVRASYQDLERATAINTPPEPHNCDYVDLIDLNTFTNVLGDRTFVVQPKTAAAVPQTSETDFQRLEKRRIELEETLGLETFKATYRRLEEIFRKENKCDSCNKPGEACYTIIDHDNTSLNISSSDCLQRDVWNLVIDDYIFTQRQ